MATPATKKKTLKKVIKAAPAASAPAKKRRPRDPVKTERNRMIAAMKIELKAMLPQVLAETGYTSEQSFNAMIGGKAAEFIDLHHEVILSPDAYAALYMRGFKATMSPKGKFQNAHRTNYETLRSSQAAQKYFMLFLKPEAPARE
jgi:hypothetical protein